MSDLRILGGSGRLLHTDGTTSFAASVESAEVCLVETDLLYPLGPGGDCVFRRIYLPFSYRSEITVFLDVAVDGFAVPEASVALHRLGAGRDAIRATLARRGTAIALQIKVEAPANTWSLELGAQVAFTPGARARRMP